MEFFSIWSINKSPWKCWVFFLATPAYQGSCRILFRPRTHKLYLKQLNTLYHLTWILKIQSNSFFPPPFLSPTETNSVLYKNKILCFSFKAILMDGFSEWTLILKICFVMTKVYLSPTSANSVSKHLETNQEPGTMDGSKAIIGDTLYRYKKGYL